MMCYNVIGKIRCFRDPGGIVLPSFQSFQDFASCFKTVLDVSYVFEVSIRMHKVTVKILSLLG
jgi:hypothetical protein